MRHSKYVGVLLLGAVLGGPPREAAAADEPRVRSMTPTSVMRGQTVEVTIEGSGLFPHEEIKGVKPEMGLQIFPVAGSTAFKLRLRVTIPDTAPQGPAPISIRTSKGTVVTDKLVVKWRTPIVNKVKPDVLTRGGEYDVSIEGLRLAIPGQETKVSVEPPMTVQKVRGTETSLQVRVVVPPETPPGPKAVSVETTDGRAPAAFTVTLSPPLVSSVVPASRDAGTTGPVVLKGKNLAGVKSVVLATAEAGLGVAMKGAPTADSVALEVGIAADVAPGPRLLVVMTPDGAVAAMLLVTVPRPTLSSVTPNGARRGTTTNIVVKGDHLGPVPALRFLPADPKVTITAGTAGAPASVTVAPDALLGPRTLLAVTRDGVAALPFLVNARGPTITGLAPADVAPGATVDIAVDGQDLEGARFDVVPADPAVSVTAGASPGRLRVEAKPDAVPGSRALLVATSDGATVAHFSIGGGSVAAPVVSNVEPVRVSRGAETEVVLRGVNLRARGDKPPDVTVTRDGAVVASTVASATPSEVRLRLRPTDLGTHVVALRTPDGASAAVFQVVPAAPSIASALPDRLPRAGAVEVRLTGANLVAAGGAPPAVALAGPAGTPSIPVTVVASAPAELRLRVEIPPSTPPGPLVLTISTADGGAAVPLPLLPAPPAIERIEPRGIGVPASVEFAVTGSNLVQPDGKPPALAVTRVGAASAISAQVLEAAPATLRVRLTTPPGTPPGPYVLLVKTADGTAAALLAVTDAAPPRFTAIDAAAGTRLGTFLTRIRGTGLAGATEVRVSGKGVVATVLPGGTDTELPVRLEVAAEAEIGPRTLTVVGPGGLATNEKVTFTVH